MVGFFKIAAFTALVLVCVQAHPGEHHGHARIKREVIERDHLANRYAHTLSRCADSLKARALNERAVARRAATAKRLRLERGLDAESKPYLHRRILTALEDFEKIDHNATGIVPATSSPEQLFAANTSCILTPENTVGPYYVSGEYVRSNVTETQEGIPMHLEMQFIDTATCEPVPSLLLDIWACNSTGIYSGIDTSQGEGGLNSTYMRGVQQTDCEGVVEFDSIFPGHYTGRATHQHVLAHTNATVLPNGTFSGGTVSHIGQLFFDESLRSAVEATYPYNTNTQDVVSNDDDMWAPTGADNGYDPFPEFVYIGESIEDGLLVWISVGIDTGANYTSDASIAAFYQADGGHTNSDSTFGGGMTGGNGTMGNGTMPANATVFSNDTAS